MRRNFRMFETQDDKKRTLMRIVRSWFVIILGSVCAFAATSKGVIQGVVVDEGGTPVAAAQVTTSYDLDSKDVEVQMARGFQPRRFLERRQSG